MGESNESWHVEAPQDGEVVVSVVKATVTEKEINDDREGIVDRLHAAYLSLVDSMAPYQKEWDADWQKALEDATLAGLEAGLKEWGGDFADYFKKETWTDLGGKIEKAAGSAYDTASDYAGELNKKITSQVNSALAKTGEILEHSDETLANWTWWSSVLEEAVSKPLKDLEEQAMKTVTEVTETAKKVQKVYQHRDAILNLPVLLVEGDPKPIQNFVDTVLKDIDPELAKAIREDPKFYVVLEVLADHESALAYLSYAGLAFEAIPPNFYAYLAREVRRLRACGGGAAHHHRALVSRRRGGGAHRQLGGANRDEQREGGQGGQAGEIGRHEGAGARARGRELPARHRGFPGCVKALSPARREAAEGPKTRTQARGANEEHD